MEILSKLSKTMEENVMRILAFFLALMFSSPSVADVWADEDGVSVVRIHDDVLTIYSLDDFYFFDQLFTEVRQGSSLRLCVGFGGQTGMGSDCLGLFDPVPAFYNQGKNRALHFDIAGLSFIFSAFEDYLRSGEEMKVSIDNGDLFSAYNLSASFMLTDEAVNVLSLEN